MDVEGVFENGVTSLVVQNIATEGLDPWTATVMSGIVEGDIRKAKSGFGTGDTPAEAIEVALSDHNSKQGGTSE